MSVMTPFENPALSISKFINPPFWYALLTIGRAGIAAIILSDMASAGSDLIFDIFMAIVDEISENLSERDTLRATSSLSTE